MNSWLPYLVILWLLSLGWNESFKSRFERMTSGEGINALVTTPTPSPTPVPTPAPTPVSPQKPKLFKATKLSPIRLGAD